MLQSGNCGHLSVESLSPINSKKADKRNQKLIQAISQASSGHIKLALRGPTGLNVAFLECHCFNLVALAGDQRDLYAEMIADLPPCGGDVG